MTRGGFDFRKRRPFPGWGAKREWPALNPLPGDPDLFPLGASGGTTATKTGYYSTQMTSNLSLADNTFTAVVWDDTVSDRRGTNAPALTTTTKISIPIDGMYFLHAKLDIATAANADGWLEGAIVYNGNSVAAAGHASRDWATNDPTFLTVDMSVTAHLPGGGYVEVYALQKSGAARNLLSTSAIGGGLSHGTEVDVLLISEL